MTDSRTYDRRTVLSRAALAVGGAGALTGSAAASAEASTTTAQTDGQSEYPVSLHYEVSNVSDRDWAFEVTLTFENPEVQEREGVDAIGFGFDEETMEVGDHDGFREDRAGNLEAEPDAGEATVHYSVDGTEEDLARVPSYDDSHEIVSLSSIGPTQSYGSTDDATYDIQQSYQYDGEGTLVGTDVLIVGPYEQRERSTSSGTFTLLEPGETAFDQNYWEIFGAMRELADGFPLDTRHDRIWAFPAPTQDGKSGAAGDDWFWVGRVFSLGPGPGVWVHEFSHVMDTVEKARDLQWLSEAYAEYAEHYVPLEIAHTGETSEYFYETGFRDFRFGIQTGRSYDADLRDPDEYADGEPNEDADYYQGALVLGALDRKLRDVTDGETTIHDVVAELAAQDGEATYDDFMWALIHNGSHGTAADAYSWITGQETPDVWDADEHERVFGYDPRHGTPTAEIGDPGTIYANNYFRISSSVEPADAPIESYEWDMGDGTTRTGWYTGHYYDEPGEYEITLTVTDAVGEQTTVSRTVTVREWPS